MPIEPFVLPPGGPLLLALAGVLLLRRAPRAGRALLGAGLGALYLASTPMLAGTLLVALQDDAVERLPDAAALRGAGAVVVLGGDVRRGEPDEVGRLTLERLRHAARVHRASGLPVLVSGGPVTDSTPVAAIMARALRDDFGQQVRWIEDRSADTRANLARTAELLAGEGIDRIVLVTHAWHMPRALVHAGRAGLAAVPAPAAPHPGSPPGLQAWLPSARALRDTSLACHEWLGLLWARLGGG